MKNLPHKERDAIVEFADTNSIKDTCAWIAKEYKIETSKTAVGNFLSWMEAEIIRQMDSILASMRKGRAGMPYIERWKLNQPRLKLR